jgi:serine protease
MRQTQTLVRAVCVGLAILFGVATQAAAQNGRYIVKFNPGRSNAGQAALRAAGGQVELVLDPQDAVAARIPAGALNGLSRNPNIDYIEEDVIREPYSTWSNVSTTGTEVKPYGIQMVQADQVIIAAATAAAKKICIIDSGYYDGHEDLKGGVTFSTNGGSGTWNKDSCGHGSHVAGTIAAIAGNSVGVVGVNPDVSLHIVKVFGDDVADSGSCGWTYSSTLVSALNACTNAGANVVSMSLGGGLKSRTEENAFKTADANGVLSVAAAGNAGNKTTSYPAGYASVMSVAAVDATETVASFSQKNRDVEIAAPGVSVLSTLPWSSTNTLTSGATTWSGSWIEGAAHTTGPGTTGTIVDGGQCTSSVGAWSGAVVLCQRGTNSFAEKVANVLSASGSAAVIYNNSASDPACGVFSGTLNGTSTIPAIALSCADGAAALARAGFSGTVVSTVVYPPTSTGGYEAWDGTSMATPHASAVAALIWACNPTKTNAEVRDALNKSALDKGTAGRDTSYGFGIVQAKASLLRLGLGSCTVTP